MKDDGQLQEICCCVPKDDRIFPVIVHRFSLHDEGIKHDTIHYAIMFIDTSTMLDNNKLII